MTNTDGSRASGFRFSEGWLPDRGSAGQRGKEARSIAEPGGRRLAAAYARRWYDKSMHEYCVFIPSFVPSFLSPSLSSSLARHKTTGCSHDAVRQTRAVSLNVQARYKQLYLKRHGNENAWRGGERERQWRTPRLHCLFADFPRNEERKFPKRSMRSGERMKYKRKQRKQTRYEKQRREKEEGSI